LTASFERKIRFSLLWDFIGVSEMRVKNTQETDISVYKVALGNLDGGSFTRYSERQMKKASREGASLSWGLGGRAPFLLGS
jgi:hypothetical protein